MNSNFTPGLYALALCIAFYSSSIKAQQIVPIKLVTESERFGFAISGILTGDLSNSEFSTKETSKQASGHLFLDANISDFITGSIHINALSTDQIQELDSIDLNTLAFAHNRYVFNLSIRARKEKNSHVYKAFSDYALSTSEFEKFDGRDAGETFEMILHKLNLGFEYSWIADWDQDLVWNASIKYNFTIIDFPFEQKNRVNSSLRIAQQENLLNRYSGLSLKTSIQLNNVAVFFETQNNFKAFRPEGTVPIPGYVNRTFYSIGFTTTSTAILAEKNKSGKESGEKKGRRRR